MGFIIYVQHNGKHSAFTMVGQCINTQIQSKVCDTTGSISRCMCTFSKQREMQTQKDEAAGVLSRFFNKFPSKDQNQHLVSQSL